MWSHKLGGFFSVNSQPTQPLSVPTLLTRQTALFIRRKKPPIITNFEKRGGGGGGGVEVGLGLPDYENSPAFDLLG